MSITKIQHCHGVSDRESPSVGPAEIVVSWTCNECGTQRTEDEATSDAGFDALKVGANSWCPDCLAALAAVEGGAQ